MVDRALEPPRVRGSRSAPIEGPGVGGIPGEENLRLDEANLFAGGRAARAAYLSTRSISIGVRQTEGAPAAYRARTLGLPVHRRRSGGTGLLHEPGDLTWSVVLPRKDPRAKGNFVSAYPRLGAGVIDWLADLGLRGRWSEPFSLSESYCLLGGRGQVLTVGGRALGGAAQHATASALLHHGTVNYQVDRRTLSHLFDLEEGTLLQVVTSLWEEGIRERPSELSVGLLARLREWIGE